MIDYRGGEWGFHVAFGWSGSLAPRALVMALPNAILTFGCAMFLQYFDVDSSWKTEKTSEAATLTIAAITPIMIFVLYNRSRTSYDRWWEGGTLLQKTRGEWFNAYSSIIAFVSMKPELQEQVDAYVHLLARLMSLLMCCGLQQVSPNRDRPFEIIGLDGIEPTCIEFLNKAPDKVEIIMQWIQRSIILQQQTGVLPVAPPILSRAFQEVSRGIVNLQNARKIAEFPYPYPLAQVSMILQMCHWLGTPIGAALALPPGWAVLFSFFSIFVLWCIHFNALDLEFPFGSRVNDLPMVEFQQDWNSSIRTLVDRRASRPPLFEYEPELHGDLSCTMSDASECPAPIITRIKRKIANIKVAPGKGKKNSFDSVMGAPAPSLADQASECSVQEPNEIPAPPEFEVPYKKEVLEIPQKDSDTSTGSTTGSRPRTSQTSVSPSHQSNGPSHQSVSQATINLVGGKALAQLTLPVELLMLDGSSGSSGTADAVPNDAGERRFLANGSERQWSSSAVERQWSTNSGDRQWRNSCIANI